MAERPQDGTYGVDFAQQEAIALASKMQLELEVKSTDVLDQLVNKDFEGDFFNIGDTVKVVSIDPNSIKVFDGDKNDMRPKLDHLAFGQNTMTIDRIKGTAFQIKDLDRLEDRWNHESAAHALAARQLRRFACLDVLNLITDITMTGTTITGTKVGLIGTFANPAVDLSDASLTPEQKGNSIYRLLNAMKQYLNTTGAVNGEAYSYGTNPTVEYRGTASLFVPPSVHTALLNAQYVRYDDVTEDVIKNGKYEKIAGLLLNSTPELDGTYATHVKALDIPTEGDFGIIILGTKNTVTRAGKVLPPEKMRDYTKFADNYYAREIYGRMIACPEACVMAIIKLGTEFTVATDIVADGLFKQYAKQDPARQQIDNIADNYPQLANNGYANAIEAGGYATAEDLAGHTHTIEAESIDGTNPVADIVLPVDEGE